MIFNMTKLNVSKSLTLKIKRSCLYVFSNTKFGLGKPQKIEYFLISIQFWLPSSSKDPANLVLQQRFNYSKGATTIDVMWIFDAKSLQILKNFGAWSFVATLIIWLQESPKHIFNLLLKDPPLLENLNKSTSRRFLLQLMKDGLKKRK